MAIPICILAFDRPGYFREVIGSIREFMTFSGLEFAVHLFQDGAYSTFCSRDVADPFLCEENVRIFAEMFPEGVIHRAEENLGVARNFDRAERYAFDDLGAPFALFFEDDMVVDKYYLIAMNELGNYALREERIGLFSAYGSSVMNPLEEQHRNHKLLAQINHNWAFELTKTFWKKRQPFVDKYLEIVGKFDYREKHKVTREVQNAQIELGFRKNVISQDMFKGIVTCYLGAVRVTPFPNRGIYIGEHGLHFDPDVFRNGFYAETIMYDDKYDGFDELCGDDLSRILNEQRIALGFNSEAKPKKLTLLPHMTRLEQDTLARHIRSVQFLLEFGCGGSTILAGALGIPRIVSVDSDKSWLSKVADTPELQNSNFLPIYVDIGPTGAWGNPSDNGQALKWPGYYTSVWSHVSQGPDAVLIDGRFRVACVLYSLLQCDKHSLYIIHDFWDRDYYHCVLEFLECIERVDSLGIFVAKEIIDWRKLAQLLQAHSLDCR